MEIIHLILGKANPQRLNGVNRVVYHLATKQAEYDYPVEVWGITPKVTSYLPGRKFTTRLYQKQKNPFALDPKLIRDIGEKRNKAIFHLHGGWIPAFASAGKILEKSEIPFILTPHGAYNTIAMQRSPLVKKIYHRIFESRLIRRSKTIHCLGSSEVNGLNELQPGMPARVLRYGFRSPDVAPVPATKSGFTVGFVGRIDLYTKGLDLLVEAMARIKRNSLDIQCWIIGDGHDFNRLKQLVQTHQLEQTCRLFGSRHGVEKDQLMANLDVFVHPSRNEGLPNAVLEAASLRVPVVVSTATNVAELVTQYRAGIEIPDNDSNALTQAILKLYQEHQTGQLPERAFQAEEMIRREFDWGRTLRQYHSMYSDAFNKVSGKK